MSSGPFDRMIKTRRFSFHHLGIMGMSWFTSLTAWVNSAVMIAWEASSTIVRPL